MKRMGAKAPDRNYKLEETNMKRVYYTPEFEATKFEVEEKTLKQSPTGEGYTITNPWTTSDPDETIDDLDW